MYKEYKDEAYAAGVTSSVPQVARVVLSCEESERCEKTLHHLSGRVDELRERLATVLLPSMPTETPRNANSDSQQGSPLTDRLRSYQRIAQGAINTVEDILNRLDV